MEINLLPIMNCEGRKLPIEAEVLLPVRPEDSFELTAPVSVSGEAVNFGGAIELTLSASAQVRFTCDRCAEEFDREIRFIVSERLKKEDTAAETQDEDPDLIYYTGNAFELDEILYDNLFLNLPTKALCREDCRGLCPHCGKNLNDGSCGCDGRQADPRFDILDQLDL